MSHVLGLKRLFWSEYHAPLMKQHLQSPLVYSSGLRLFVWVGRFLFLPELAETEPDRACLVCWFIQAAYHGCATLPSSLMHTHTTWTHTRRCWSFVHFFWNKLFFELWYIVKCRDTCHDSATGVELICGCCYKQLADQETSVPTWWGSQDPGGA